MKGFRHGIRLSLVLAIAILLAPCFTLPAYAQQPIGTVASPIVNVRAGPGTTYNVLAQASQGTILTITGRNAASDWYQVCCVNNLVGWIYGSLLVIEGSVATVPVIAAPPGGAVPPPPTNFAGWQGEYYANRDLQGAPSVVRDDPWINFRWEGASPAPGIPGTNFSARWTRTVNFAAGDYTFYATIDDGIRLWVDNILLLNDWREGSLRTVSKTFNQLGAGNHTIRVEYFQAGGDSAAIVWWERANQFPEWKGEYWDNINLQGSPALVRNDPVVDFSWGLGSPAPQIPADNFSVRWTRRINFSGGDYLFSINVDDGTRVYLNGRAVIDEWHDVDSWTNYTVPVHYLGGEHTVIIEYYARGGIAYCQFTIVNQSSGGGGEKP